jgi:hypothetical protein
VRTGRWIAALAAWGVLSAPAAHAVSEQVPIGARAIAMGGAFSSIAEDATALFWNPAGLARIGNQELLGGHASPFGTGINDDFLSFVLPLSLDQVAGVDWYHSGFDDDELGFGENRVDLAYGLRVRPWISAGANVKYLTQNTSLDGLTVRHGRGFGVDLGVLASPREDLNLALVAQDLFGTSIEYFEGGSDVVYPRNIRAGVSYTYQRAVTAAFDVDDRWHAGLEYSPNELIALRGGFEDDREGSEEPNWSYGAGLRAGIFRVDYARVIHPTLDATNHFALGMEFNFNPAQVRIEKVAVEDLYASQHKSYAGQPFGSARVRNLLDTPVETRIGIQVPEWMDAPSDRDIVLRPKAVQEIPLTAVFPSRVLEGSGDRPVEVEVTASYQSRRLMRRERSTARCVAYGPGAVDWSRGVAQAAAFVTTRDPAVDALARSAARSAVRDERNAFGNRNLAFAAAITDALATLGIAYVPDPNNPFSAISQTPHAVDTIHYPHETLERRAGDCDDTSVLMAALLENVGVSTSFVDAPGHLFLLVDTGLHERHRFALGVDESRYVVRDEAVWIPLETTALGRGFAESWRLGAEAYAGLGARDSVALVDVAEAQSRFEPVEPPGARRLVVPDSAQLQARLERDARAIAALREGFWSTRPGTEPGAAPTPQAQDQLAQVYFEARRFDQARSRLEEVVRMDPRSARPRNNLAVVLAAQGDLARAASECEAALAADREDPGIWLNLGLIRSAAGDSARARQAMAEARARAGSVDRLCDILQLEAPDCERLAALAGRARSAGTSSPVPLKAGAAPGSPRLAPGYWKE